MQEEVKEQTNPIEKAERLLAEVKQQNAELISNLERLEKLKAEEILSGRAEASKPSQKLEETPQEYARRIMGEKL